MHGVAFVVGWLLCAAGALAQVPLRVEAAELRQCRVSATATPDALVVELHIADGWHAYTEDVGGGMPVQIELDDGCDYRAAGELQKPAANKGAVTGTARWTLPIAAKGDGGRLHATVRHQVCDALECLMPQTVAISGRLDAFEVLLVSGVQDERSERIAALLAERGFEVTATTYADVTAEQCDAHEVVLADSKRFGGTARVREQVLKFPATSTPIVGVGFWGTELFEAQGVAMTSGYI